MESLLAEGSGDGKSSSVYGSARGSGGERWDMANEAPDFVEKFFTVLYMGASRKCEVSRGSLGGSHEASEMIDIGKAVAVRLVVGFLNGVAEISDFVRKQAVGDA